MYRAIAKNKRNTVFIIVIFLLIIGGLASIVAWYFEDWSIAIITVIITEGGASFPDVVGADGRVDDSQRIDYLAQHIAVAARSVPGVDLRGYIVWSLLDNFEWAAGYTQRFGLVHVDFATLVRTPKASYHWLRGVLKTRGTI